jgi:hypothetical protein
MTIIFFSPDDVTHSFQGFVLLWKRGDSQILAVGLNTVKVDTTFRPVKLER